MRISDWSSDVCSSDLAVESSFNFTLLALLIGTAVAMLFAGAAWFVLSRAIAAPINGMSAFMGRLADGHYDDMTANQERGDEIGMMAKSGEFFRQRPIENREMQASAEHGRASRGGKGWSVA